MTRQARIQLLAQTLLLATAPHCAAARRVSPPPAGSPDLVAARKVADFLGTIHHEFTFTVEEGIDALFDLIWHIESYEQVCAR